MKEWAVKFIPVRTYVTELTFYILAENRLDAINKTLEMQEPVKKFISVKPL